MGKKTMDKSQKRKAEEVVDVAEEEDWESEEELVESQDGSEDNEEHLASFDKDTEDSDEEPEEISTVKSKEKALHLQNEEKLKKLETQMQLKQKRRERDLKNSLQQQQKRARLLPQEIIEAAQEEEEEPEPEQPKISNTHVRLEKKLESAKHGNITVTIAKNRISNPIDPELLEFRNKHLHRSSVKRAPVLKNFKILDTKTVPTSVSFQLSRKK
ncbi:hypothetical protein HDV06_004572 [Boothiomyces sp. JEL0866]|nr:hypothetical protein HDV06_004572 [Boothiomyces sp. JEL0866]